MKVITDPFVVNELQSISRDIDDVWDEVWETRQAVNSKQIVKSVQRGSVVVNTSTASVNVALASVDLSKSVCFVGPGRGSGSYSTTHGFSAHGRLTTGVNLNIEVNRLHDNDAQYISSSAYVRWEVIEYA